MKWNERRGTTQGVETTKKSRSRACPRQGASGKVRLVSTSIWARLSTKSLAMDCPVCRRRMLSTLIARDDPATT
ncbi:hypothetical protein V6N11_030947 [Hibiscus sabdariffa]|uniref:Uncharacterized protein n=1 Tax=Hibiscus sabdariffa TaxID=183260 RepID=A0ABR2NS20_9ROSI